MKLEGQNIPAELADAYASLISTNPADTSGKSTARTRRAARESQAKAAVGAHSARVSRIIQALENLHLNLGTPGIDSVWRHARKSALLDGLIESDWWIPAELLDVQHLKSTPSFVESFEPTTYLYRDPLNRPSVPTYPAGEPEQGQPQYSGSLKGDIYSDDKWVWRNSCWLRDSDIYAQAPGAAFVIIEGAQTIDTSNRASRPMLSIGNQIQSAPNRASFADELAAPMRSPWRHYWRYELPPAVSPYWHGTIQRRILQGLPLSSASGSGEYCLLQTGPSPMLGRGWNNNTTVNIEFSGFEILYEAIGDRVKRPVSWFRGSQFSIGGQFSQTPFYFGNSESVSHIGLALQLAAVQFPVAVAAIKAFATPLGYKITSIGPMFIQYKDARSAQIALRYGVRSDTWPPSYPTAFNWFGLANASFTD